MPVGLYMDVHVPQAITDQLRRRDVDVLTAIEDGSGRRSDEDLLERARSLGRVIVTQDIRFKRMAESWQRNQRTFSGLVFAHPLQITIGQWVRDLELIAKASDPAEWQNTVERLPL